MTSAVDDVKPSADLEDVINRDFDAPARLLFKAWSSAEHLLKWFGPKGWPLTLCEVDFKVGGRFRFAMTGSSGVQNTPFGGEYLEIVPDRKIVFDNGFEEPGAEHVIVTVEFDEQDGKTRLSVRTLFPTIAMKEMFMNSGYAQGYASAFDQLDALLDELKRQEAL